MCVPPRRGESSAPGRGCGGAQCGPGPGEQRAVPPHGRGAAGEEEEELTSANTEGCQPDSALAE